MTYKKINPKQERALEQIRSDCIVHINTKEGCYATFAHKIRVLISPDGEIKKCWMDESPVAIFPIKETK